MVFINLFDAMYSIAVLICLHVLTDWNVLRDSVLHRNYWKLKVKDDVSWVFF